jgi:STE24 endopeptidase
MAIVNLLLLFVIWMAWSPSEPGRAWMSPGAGVALFFGGYAVLLVAVGLWSRWLAQRVSNERIMDGMRRFNWVIGLARMLVPGWFAVGVFMLGWASRVQVFLGPVANWGILSPGLILGIAPGLLAWIGLWCAQFPVDRALREQNVVSRLDRDLPVYAPPGFWIYFVSKLRMQLLLILVPILMIVLLRDLGSLILRWTGVGGNNDNIDSALWAGSMILVFVISPEVLRRVLATERLPDPELRERLRVISDRAGVNARVLLWRTHHTVGNALVMGPVAWFRYVLLSDLLLESLADDEVAAVFAHEVGHITNRHIIWYGIFLFGMGLALFGLNDLARRLALHAGIDPLSVDQAFPVVEILVFVTCFGFLSRRFERQADVYAARTLEAIKQSTQPGAATHVGPEGAKIFNSALLRVSEVNNVPLETYSRFAGSAKQRVRFLSEWFGNLGGSWLHGTMASRMRYIEEISRDPKLTALFDSRMRRIKVGLLALVLGCAGWAAWAAEQEPGDLRSTPTPAPALAPLGVNSAWLLRPAAE